MRFGYSRTWKLHTHTHSCVLGIFALASGISHFASYTVARAVQSKLASVRERRCYSAASLASCFSSVRSPMDRVRWGPGSSAKFGRDDRSVLRGSGF